MKIVTLTANNFILHRDVDKIKIKEVVTGKNKLYYKGTDLAKLVPIVIPVYDIKKGRLTYELNATEGFIKDKITKYIESGWILEEMSNEYATMKKEGLPSQKIYIGDTKPNKITYSVASKGSIRFHSSYTINVVVEGKRYSAPSNLRMKKDVYVNDPVFFNLKEYFPSAVSIKIENQKTGYLMPDHLAGIMPADSLIRGVVNRFTPEISRILSSAKLRGEEYIGMDREYIYFQKGKEVIKISTPRRPSYVEFRISEDGVNFSKGISRIRFVDVSPLLSPEEIGLKNKDIGKVTYNKSILVSSSNTIYTPSEIYDKTIEAYE